MKKKNLSEEEQMEFFMKIGKYMRTHPEFVEELEERMAEEENPQYAKKDLNYFMKKGFSNIKKGDVEGVASELSSVFFKKDSSNKSLLERTAEEALSKIVSGYLSKYLGK